MSLLRSLVASSQSIANAFVTPRYTSRSSTADNPRAVIADCPHRATTHDAHKIKLSGAPCKKAATRPDGILGKRRHLDVEDHHVRCRTAHHPGDVLGAPGDSSDGVILLGERLGESFSCQPVVVGEN